MKREMVEKIVQRQMSKAFAWSAGILFILAVFVFTTMWLVHSNEREFYVEQNTQYFDMLQEHEVLIDSLQRELDKNRYELNWENIAYWLDHYKVKNKKVVMGQIYIETANLTSNLCVNHNNLVGMYWPVSRPTTAKFYVIADEGNKVSSYKYWWQSLQDYKLWQDYFGYGEMEFDEYAQTLDRHGYSITPGYYLTVMRVYEEKVKGLL